MFCVLLFIYSVCINNHPQHPIIFLESIPPGLRSSGIFPLRILVWRQKVLRWIVEGRVVSWWIQQGIQESSCKYSQGWKWVDEWFFLYYSEGGINLIFHIYTCMKAWGHISRLWHVLLLRPCYYWICRYESKIQKTQSITRSLGQWYPVWRGWCKKQRGCVRGS